jgi:DNA-binding response OmpR family regulator
MSSTTLVRDSLNILMIEDCAADIIFYSDLLKNSFKKNIIIDTAATLQAVHRLSESRKYNLIIIDLNVFRNNGMRTVKIFRGIFGEQIPIIILTNTTDANVRINALLSGADDYLVKPFAAPELVARLKALVRRSNPRPVDLQLGGLQLDPFARRATIDGLTIELSAREWAVLEYLMQHASRVVSKQQIIDAILPWGEEVTLNAVEVYISRIRAKIDKAGISIKTIRGFGYMLEQSAR